MYFKASWTMRKYFGNPWFWWVGVLIIWWIPASQESGLVDRKSDWAQTGCSRTGRKDPALTLDLSCTNHRPCRYRRPPKLQQTSRDTWAVEAVPIDRYRQVQSMYQILLGSCKFNFLLKCLTFFNSFFCIIFQYFSLIFLNKVFLFFFALHTCYRPISPVKQSALHISDHLKRLNIASHVSCGYWLGVCDAPVHTWVKRKLK